MVNRESEPQRIGEILPDVMANIEKRMLENRLKNDSEDNLKDELEAVGNIEK